MKAVQFIEENKITFCRYIKNGKTVEEIRIKDGSNHIERLDVAIKHRINFDYYFIYYQGEYSGRIDFGRVKKDNPFIALGIDKECTQMFLFDSRTNKIVREGTKIIQQ